MKLLLLALIMGTVAVLLFLKDRRALRRTLPEAVSEPARKYLNLPGKTSPFAERLKSLSGQRPSRRLLEEQNAPARDLPPPKDPTSQVH